MKQLAYLATSGAALALVFIFAAQTAAAHSPLKALGPSVAIGENGGALVRGAEVTSISNGTITAKTAWDDASITWSVDTDSSTQYLGDTTNELSDIEVGDEISFSGVLTSSSTVDASVIREWNPERADDHDSGKGNDDKVHKQGWKWGDIWAGMKARFGGH